MALLNSLFSGVSGLRAHQEMMDVIGNNVANVNTIGFKSSRVTFSDTFNKLIVSGTNATETSGGTNSFQVGLGMKVNSIDRDWSQGTFETTSTTTDLALEGDGLFILESNGETYYSRAGAFNFDSNGNLVNSSNGAIVQGKVADGLGRIPSGNTLQDITVDMNLKLAAVKTTETSWSGNLESSSTTIKTDTVDLSGNLKLESSTAGTYPGGTFSATDSSTYEVSTIYNEDGDEYQLWSYYTEASGTPGTWTYNYQIRDSDGNALTTPVTGSYALTFDSDSGECTNVDQTITVAGEGIDYDISFSELTNMDSSSSAGTTIDSDEVAEDVTGSMTIYDSLGTAHTLTITFKHLDSNTWSWEASIPADEGSLGSDSYGVIEFDSDGVIKDVYQAGNKITTSPAAPEISFAPSDGADSQSMTLDFGESTSGITQTNLSSSVSALDQNGSAAATLSSINIDEYGNIEGVFSNGSSRTLAQIMVATFNNLDGLVSVGDNMYKVAANSGDPIISEAGESSNTTIQSGALEESNVDLSTELTNLIVAQRGYQANARIITTADTLLQEVTNLIR